MRILNKIRNRFQNSPLTKLYSKNIDKWAWVINALLAIDAPAEIVGKAVLVRRKLEENDLLWDTDEWRRDRPKFNPNSHHDIQMVASSMEYCTACEVFKDCDVCPLSGDGYICMQEVHDVVGWFN